MDKEELKKFLCSEGMHNWRDGTKPENEVDVRYGSASLVVPGKRCVWCGKEDFSSLARYHRIDFDPDQPSPFAE